MERPDPRLYSAVQFIKPGSRCIDVGTDHAYLPIYLVESGICPQVLASDINQGPIDSASQHIRAAGLEDKILTRRADGLSGLENFRPDTVLIFGMGGELIARILEDAPWTKSKETDLVLQPMSRVGLLRAFLYENGYSIIGEALSQSGRIYQTLHARYTGEKTEYTQEELLLGRWNIEHPSPLFVDFVRHEKQVLERVREGKAQSKHADLSYENEMIALLAKRLENLS